MATTLINADDVEDAGRQLQATSGDVTNAASDSSTNAANVVATADEIKASRTRVDGFIQGLINNVNSANQRVIGTEWQSPSRERFEGAVGEFTGKLKNIGDRYVEEYDKAIVAVGELQEIVNVIDQDFDRVCSDAAPLIDDYGRTAIEHAQQQRELADRGIQIG